MTSRSMQHAARRILAPTLVQNCLRSIQFSLQRGRAALKTHEDIMLVCSVALSGVVVVRQAAALRLEPVLCLLICTFLLTQSEANGVQAVQKGTLLCCKLKCLLR